jgi:hypothetical protein
MAMTPGTALLGEYSRRGALARRRQEYPVERSSKSAKTDDDVSLAPVDGSTWSRVRLIFYEYYGKGWMRGRYIFLVPLLILPITAAAGYFIGGDGANRSYPHHLNLAAQLAVKQHADLHNLIWLMLGSVLPFSYAVWPKMDAIYPFSRHERFRILALWSVMLELLALVVLFFGICGEAWGQSLAKNNFDARLVMETGLLLACIISPVAQWGAFYRSRRRIYVANALYVVSWIAIVAVISWSDPRFLAAIFSPVGLLAAAALAFGLHFAYFSNLRRICQKTDLVLRGS